MFVVIDFDVGYGVEWFYERCGFGGLVLLLVVVGDEQCWVGIGYVV